MKTYWLCRGRGSRIDSPVSALAAVMVMPFAEQGRASDRMLAEIVLEPVMVTTPSLAPNAKVPPKTWSCRRAVSGGDKAGGIGSVVERQSVSGAM